MSLQNAQPTHTLQTTPETPEVPMASAPAEPPAPVKAKVVAKSKKKSK